MADKLLFNSDLVYTEIDLIILVRIKLDTQI